MRRSWTGRRPVAAAVDTALIVVFSTFGRGAHSEGIDPAQVWSTAWPFLVGLLAGWGVLATGVVPGARDDPRSGRSGLTVWAFSLGIGMALWWLRKGTPPHWSFVLVAGTVTALFLLGWRWIARLAARRSRPIRH